MVAKALMDVLLPAYRPCTHFSGACQSACVWDPDRGRVPCAFGGATGSLDDVRLIIVTAEPGDPPDNAGYRGSPECMLENSLAIFDQAMRHRLERHGRPTPFHRNIRRVLDCFWPDSSLEHQLRLTWTTNAVLCPAPTSGGAHRRGVEDACASTYLRPQLALFPKSFVLALGKKAEHRMRRAGLRIDAIGHHPCARGSTTDKLVSWQKAAAQFIATPRLINSEY